jgi:chaperonin cofactor prefoldin
MKFVIVLSLFQFVVWMWNDVQGMSVLNGNLSLETSQAIPGASTAHVTNVLRDLVNQESLVRFSMVQKIQELTLTLVDNKKENDILKKDVGDLKNDVKNLKKANQELWTKNEELHLKVEGMGNQMENLNDSHHFKKVELELTSLS